MRSSDTDSFVGMCLQSHRLCDWNPWFQRKNFPANVMQNLHEGGFSIRTHPCTLGRTVYPEATACRFASRTASRTAVDSQMLPCLRAASVLYP
ncbi:MAG: hypothetical protein BGO91_13715 [Leifsonia sp. 71-9]|nr:MAG: hypothetical protein BGO91_13715 [Leifsonia sp. 71-9]